MINQTTHNKIFLETYGCQMNEYDTELIRSILGKEGFMFTEDELGADVVMLNTCSVRENAHRRVRGRVHTIRHHRNGNPAKIGILGCMATNLRKDLLEDRNLKIDFIAGPDSYKRLGQIIRQTVQTDEKQFDLTLSEFETYSDIYPQRKNGVNAWIAIMRGCNNFCTFCVVPYTRGRERSRTVDNIVEEAKKVAEEGFKQITLLGQNVNSYRHNNDHFADLLEKASKVEGIERIRFTSPHPKDFPDTLLKLMASNKKICNHIHLPLQAGNNRILDLMNRTYTKEEFLNLVDKIRNLIPNIVLTTDIIAGFPTETSQEFQDTLNVLNTAQFDSAYIFKYSPRKGTIASDKYPDDVPSETKTARMGQLNELVPTISLKKNQAHIDEIHAIMIERNKAGGTSLGRTDGNKLVELPSGHYPLGAILRAKITAATPHALKGEVL